jgi:hypothetical protein
MGCRAVLQFRWSFGSADEAASSRRKSHLAVEAPAHCILRGPGSRTGRISMYDLLIALAFIGLVIAPAIVATKINIEAIDDSK